MKFSPPSLLKSVINDANISSGLRTVQLSLDHQLHISSAYQCVQRLHALHLSMITGSSLSE